MECISSISLFNETLFVISWSWEIVLILLTKFLIGFIKYLSNSIKSAKKIITEKLITKRIKKLIIDESDTFKSSIG